MAESRGSGSRRLFHNTDRPLRVVLVAVGLVLSGCASAESLEGDDASYPPISEFIRDTSRNRPIVPVQEALAEADAIVLAKVVSIEDPRWNSRDGSDWRAEFEKEKESFTAPSVYTQVDLEIIEVLDSVKAAELAPGDPLEVDFLLDPSLDFVPPEDKASLDSPGVRARYLAPGDTRVFVMRWRPFPYNDGWGENRWYAEVEEGLWGVTPDGSAVYPAGQYQARELADLDLAGTSSVDGVTVELPMDQFLVLISESRTDEAPS